MPFLGITWITEYGGSGIYPGETLVKYSRLNKKLFTKNSKHIGSIKMICCYAQAANGLLTNGDLFELRTPFQVRKIYSKLTVCYMCPHLGHFFSPKHHSMKLSG